MHKKKVLPSKTENSISYRGAEIIAIVDFMKFVYKAIELPWLRLAH